MYKRAIDLVLNTLDPFLVKNGGVITAEQLVYDAKQERGNLILRYIPPGWNKEKGSISFIGSHLDVVPGKPEEWETGRNPFELSIEVSNDNCIKRKLIFYLLTGG